MNPLSGTGTALAMTAALSLAGAAAAQTPAPAPAQTQQPAAARPAPTPAPAASPARAEPVTPQVDAAFKAWDADHNGSLTLDEFRTGWRNLSRDAAQPTQARLRQQFDRVDANKNAGIDRTEYPNMVLVKQAGSAAPAFSEFDRDGSQKLEFAEYTELVRRLVPAAPPNDAPSPK
jgi:Ca2+-binding EF-hand superfamily protein